MIHTRVHQTRNVLSLKATLPHNNAALGSLIVANDSNMSNEVNQEQFLLVHTVPCQLSTYRKYHLDDFNKLIPYFRMSDLYPIEEQQPKLYEPCYYCQQSSLASSAPPCLSVPISPTTTTTLNVVINQQTVEQLIQNSLRKLFNPTII